MQIASYRLVAKILTSQRGEGRVTRWRGSDLVKVTSLVFQETKHVKRERIVVVRDAELRYTHFFIDYWLQRFSFFVV